MVDSVDAEVELKEVCEALRKQGIKHWLSSGTLLGIYRDGKFIDGDTDIDIGIMSDKVPIIDGYELKIMKIFGEVMQTVYRSPRNIAIDLMWFYEKGDNIINKNNGGTWVKPKEGFKDLTNIEFKGYRYPCPEPEWYLPKRFKDWKTPMAKEGRNWGFFAGEFLCT